jgi:hypothetical protein
MNIAYLSALAALAGSAIGALATLATTWLTQRYQDRSLRKVAENTRRERLFGEFIDISSKLLGDAITHSLDDPGKLIPLYANLGKLRLFASKATITSARGTLDQIIAIYNAPNKAFRTPQAGDDSLDILASFTANCRNELAD